MPYADPEKRRQVQRESQARRYARKKASGAPAVDRADLPEPPDRAELLRILGVQASQGNTAAIRLLLEEYRRDGDSSEKPKRSFTDELAARRARGA